MRRVLLVFGVYLAALDGIVPLQAAVIAPAFSGSYTLSDLGSASGVATPYGGIVFKAGDPNTILLGSSANDSGGAIDSIGVSPDAGHHITGFTGTAALFATPPNIDGGLAYGPGGGLFYTAYPINTIGEIKPGSAVPNKLVDPTPLGIASSVGTLAFVPPGFPGAGDFKIASYSGGGFYDATLSPDGSGTFNISSATLNTTPGGGPEG